MVEGIPNTKFIRVMLLTMISKYSKIFIRYVGQTPYIRSKLSYVLNIFY